MAAIGTAGSIHVQKITVPYEFPVCFEVHEMREDAVLAALAELRARDAAR